MDGVEYYRALYKYVPKENGNDNDEEISDIPLDKDDILEVKQPINDDIQNPKGWLIGYNQNQKICGYFPGPYVEHITPQMIKQAPQIDLPKIPHRLVDIYVIQPVLCHYCDDYMWGPKQVGKKCEGCGKHCHNECWNAPENADCHRERVTNQPVTYDKEQPIEKWSNRNVVDLLACLNLYRYAQLFKDKKINGAQLKAMSKEDLQDIGIKDEFHQSALLVCFDELCGRDTNEQPYATSLPPHSTCPATEIEASGCGGAGASEQHRFSEYSFSSMQRCHLCDKFLYGLIRQGLQCRECGMCCHRYCSATHQTECNVPKLERLRRPSFSQNSSFGAELSEEVPKSQYGAPWVVVKCTEEVEKWCRNHQAESLSVYRMFAKTEEINAIKMEFNMDDPAQISLGSHNVHCVAGVLKKYLRELPNPVIPVEMYPHFIQAAHNPSTRTLSDLIDGLPRDHKSTLKFLMAHFLRLWRIQHESGVADGLDKLSHVFCHILLRPPWERIIEIVENTKLHIEIFEELLKNGSWGEVAPPTPPPQQPRPKSPLQDTTMSAQEKLKEAEWYWGKISREEVNELLCDKSDGHFLVREATTPGDYTLTLRKGGTNKLIKIYHKDGKYGFVEPLTFDSVVELVHFYKNTSLAIYNKTLDTKLLHPVSNRNQQDGPSLVDKTEQLEKLKQVHNEHQTKMEEYDRLYETHSKLNQELQLKHQALDAFKETVIVFKEQMELHRSHHGDVPMHELQKLAENYELLKSRWLSIQESKQALEIDINKKTVLNRSLISDMNSLRPEIKRLHKQREQIRKLLQENGISMESLDDILENQPSNRKEVGMNTKKMNLWYVEVSRHDAENLLRNQRDGTFLIRPRTDGDQSSKHALSIMCNGTVGHCKIYQNNNGCYGFTEGNLDKSSLIELVDHYSRESLKEHNPNLDIRLIYPVFEGHDDNSGVYLHMHQD
ncbi:phosphatidylinositol 3-kinase regulatory subunit alpha-like isoform X2 [Saccostrea cucullata]|uniref:phosphatidylinositol 3-kinase regulatory subunit alpha-like isoform X2 n=1 Tax=Saccostrea cuccullata TaxID=36930 RepID=UPI002ED4FFF4